jgi:endonuclease YncB( thermonuclease family)
MKGKLLCILLILLCSAVRSSNKNYGSIKIKEIVRVYDGDTFYANLLGVHPIIGNNIGIRINGIDTPERRGGTCKEFAMEVRAYLEYRMVRAKKIELNNISRGKYFRIVADVYIDGVNIAEELIRKGYAKPYGGGKKTKWVCGY